MAAALHRAGWTTTEHEPDVQFPGDDRVVAALVLDGDRAPAPAVVWDERYGWRTAVSRRHPITKGAVPPPRRAKACAISPELSPRRPATSSPPSPRTHSQEAPVHVSPDPITTPQQAAQERDTLLELIARGPYCTAAVALGDGHGEPSEEALAKAKAVADDYLAAYEEWLVKLAAGHAAPGPL
ncbi:hypothetical protein [Streptomyces griseus]|uniref:hypothetical protein n=1 Tax=Streptomyces griseus TaxID=1911 RepID=UPI0038281B09